LAKISQRILEPKNKNSGLSIALAVAYLKVIGGTEYCELLVYMLEQITCKFQLEKTSLKKTSNTILSIKCELVILCLGNSNLESGWHSGSILTFHLWQPRFESSPVHQ
jgi:hypothetical protein